MNLEILPGCGAPAAEALGAPPCPVCDSQTPPEPEVEE